MSFEIPEPFCWDESFQVFYDNLDTEHKGLFNGIFNMAKEPSNEENVKTLYNLVTAHFNDEEACMEKSKYEDFPEHKKVHDEFKTKIAGLKAPVDDDTVQYAKNWLVNHIKGIDFKYKGRLG